MSETTGDNIGAARLRARAPSPNDHDHPTPFQQSDDIFSIPEEPVTEEVFEAYHDDIEPEDVRREEEGNRDEGVGKPQTWRPWYRRPSAWWMLVLMPLSAMTLAGVQPSAVQIYTNLVCRALRPDLSSAHAFDNDQTCASDPKVQAVASKLMTSIMTSLGILSCITAASWASLSDRTGRKPVLAIASIGVLCSYTLLIFVNAYSEHLPGGFWFCVVGSSVYGLLGGTAAATAATTAYIADCTPSFSRARMLSLTLGLRFTGMAIGPTLSAFLVKSFGNPIAAVYLVIIMHTFYFVIVLFVLPESLSREKKEENRARRDTSRVARRAERASRPAQAALAETAGTVFAFLRPLDVVKPIVVHLAHSGRSHKDWSLTFIAISSGVASLILASYQSQFQYGAATFGWSAVELGYWFSGIVAARALTLTVFLPIIIKLYHRFTSPKPAANSNSESNGSVNTPLLSSDSLNPRPQKHTHQHPHHTPAFDLIIAQLSLLLEVVCYGLLPFFASVPLNIYKPVYIVLSILAACGAGFGPAIQSLAVELYTRRGGTESGRLFGTLSVIQATCSQIVGPTLYGLTYSGIVETYPQGIFFVSFGAVSLAVTALFFVELPKTPSNAAGSAHMA